MELNVDLSLLLSAVKTMGAEGIRFDVSHETKPIEPIDTELGEGLEVNFEDIEFDSGLASYQGRQVLLYIKDHGGRVLEALEDGSKGKKFHISDCVTLGEMRYKGRFDRYVVTNNLDGAFKISGKDRDSGVEYNGETSLLVCKNCLKYLNYRGYQTKSKGPIFKDFKLADFFDTYSSYFKYMPSGIADSRSVGYTDDWADISKKVKERFKYKCQQCGLNLLKNKTLLHTHHINGVKHDNSLSNLTPLCADCHRKQPDHQHLFIKHQDTKSINHLRHQQGLVVNDSWQDIYNLADPALHGVVDLLEMYKLPLPDIGKEIKDTNQKIIAELGLAWPVKKIGIAIEKESAIVANENGWHVYSMRDALTGIEELAKLLR
jgi:hypothetical protein